MNTNEREICQAMSIELLLEKKIQDFFLNPAHDVTIFHAYTAKNSTLRKELELIEALIPIVRTNVATGQLKRALKLMIALEKRMNKIKSQSY